MTNSLSKEKLENITNLITPKCLVYLQKIGELKGKQVLYSNQQPEYLNKLQIDTIIENAISSNAIDNLNISQKRFLELFEEFQDPENDKESEIIRYVKVINLINSHYEALNLSDELLLQFHRNIFGYQQGQGGIWKPENKVIEKTNKNGTREIIFVPLDYNLVEEYTIELCNTYNELIEDNNLVDLIVIAAFVFDFLCIHPFSQGNGRVSRLLTQLLLYKRGYEALKYSSLDRIIKDTRLQYFESLEKTCLDWHASQHELFYWVEYFLWSIYQMYNNLDKKIFNLKSKRGAKSQQVKIVIDKLPKIFKVADIADKCPGISRPTINKVLQELRDEHLIIPNSLGRDAIWQKHD